MAGRKARVPAEATSQKCTALIEHFELTPGDTMVVPEQINKTSVLRGLTDWSTVFA